jgi:hypothetical protein
VSTSTSTPSSNAQKRKPVYRVVGSSNAEATTDSPTLSGHLDVNDPSTANEENDFSGAVRNGWYFERYDPEFITGCDLGCSAGQQHADSSYLTTEETDSSGASRNGWYIERYQPNATTGCDSSCSACGGKGDCIAV